MAKGRSWAGTNPWAAAGSTPSAAESLTSPTRPPCCRVTTSRRLVVTCPGRLLYCLGSPHQRGARMNEWVLAEQTHAFIRSQKWEVGGTALRGDRAAQPAHALRHRQLPGRGPGPPCLPARLRGRRRVVLLPTVPFGVNTNYFKVPGALACSLTPTTLLRVLTDLADSMERQGVRKLVLLNGHGGNELKPFLRELHHRTGVFLCLCDWYRMAADLYPDDLQGAGRTCRRGGNQPGPGFLPRADAAGAGRRRGRPADALRGDQPRLGEHHAPVAPGHNEHRPGQPRRGQRREGAGA